MIDMMENQLNINYTSGSSLNCDFLFPEGLNGESISFPISSTISYEVPSDKRLYVLHVEDVLLIDGMLFNTFHSSARPFILNSDQLLLTNDGPAIIGMEF